MYPHIAYQLQVSQRHKFYESTVSSSISSHTWTTTYLCAPQDGKKALHELNRDDFSNTSLVADLSVVILRHTPGNSKKIFFREDRSLGRCKMASHIVLWSPQYIKPLAPPHRAQQIVTLKWLTITCQESFDQDTKSSCVNPQSTRQHRYITGGRYITV